MPTRCLGAKSQKSIQPTDSPCQERSALRYGRFQGVAVGSRAARAAFAQAQDMQIIDDNTGAGVMKRDQKVVCLQFIEKTIMDHS